FRFRGEALALAQIDDGVPTISAFDAPVDLIALGGMRDRQPWIVCRRDHEILKPKCRADLPVDAALCLFVRLVPASVRREHSASGTFDIAAAEHHESDQKYPVVNDSQQPSTLIACAA